MGKAAVDFGLQTASSAVGAGMGMLLGGYYDKRQREQQEDLQNIQIKGQKEMADYAYNKQLAMWNATNYEAQKGHMKAAGLNPGLMYGMGGGGGVTSGTGGGAGPSGGSAPVGGREVESMIGMGIQSALLKAQKENIEANTEKTKAETGNVPLTGANIQATTGLTQINTEIAKIEASIKGRSEEASVREIDAQAEKIMQQAEQERFKTNITEATWRTEIETIQARLIGIYLNNKQTSAETNRTTQQTQQIATKIIQDWKELEIKQQNANTQQKQQNLNDWIHNVQDSTKLTVDAIQGIVGGILRKGPTKKETISSGPKGDTHTIETYK